MTHLSTMRMAKTLQWLHKAQQGSVLILVAAGLAAIMAVTGLTVEISNYTAAKSRFNNAVDQALLAAAAANSDNPTEFATQYLKTNLNETAKNIEINNFEVSSADNKSVWTATAKGSLKSTIAGVVGITEFTLQHDAEARWDNSTVSEIVAMVDVSGTMCAHFVRNPQPDAKAVIEFVPDQGCKKLAMMEAGLTKITERGVGYGVNNAGAAGYKVGIVPFTYKIKVPNPAAVPAFMYKGEQNAGYGSNYYTNLGDAEGDAGALPAVWPLKSIATGADKAALLNAIKSLTTVQWSLDQDGGLIFDNPATPPVEFNRAAWKRSALATEMSGLMFDPRYNDIFGGEKPADFGSPNTKKILIMMTDSANLGCCFTNYPSGNFRGHYIYSYAPDHDLLVGQNGVCKQLKDAGVEIYTVLLDVNRDDMDAGGQDIIDAFQKSCATDDSHAFTVGGDEQQQAKQLVNAYSTIGKALIKLRLSK